MANTGASLTTLSNILKDFYLPPVVEQLNSEVLLLQRLETRTEDLFGNQAVVPVHTKRNTGIGPAAEGAPLPAAGQQSYEKALYNLRYFYGRISVTGPSIAKTASEAGAFLRSLKSELDGVRVDLKKDAGRQAWGSGYGNGLIAKCGVTTAATTVVLSSAEAIRKGHIVVGMYVHIGTAGAPTSISTTAREVTAVNVAAGTFVISGAAVTTSATSFVSRAVYDGTTNSTAAGSELLGVCEYVNDTAGVTIGGIDPTVAGKEVWDNARLMNTGSPGTPRAVSLDLIGQAFSLSRAQGGNISLMAGSLGMERALFLLLQSQVRYMNPNDIKGGFKALDFMGRPFVADVDHPWGRINMLDESYVKVFSNQDWHFLDEDGDVLKWVTGYDKWEAALARYFNVGPTRRNVHVVLGDLTDAGV